jgi:hypothetical protein
VSQLSVFDDRTLPAPPRAPILCLTVAQKSHLQSLARALGLRNVAVVGFDMVRQPVVKRRDANGTATYVILRDGCGRNVAGAVTQLTDDELLEFNPGDMTFLGAFPTRLKEAT